MASQSPLIDRRTATDIARQVRDLLGQYAPDWREEEYDGSGQLVKTDTLAVALINIFGRLSEIIIQRLNCVPDKNFLAFMNLLGVSLLPPQPARAPLTFTLAAGTGSDTVVPAGTQVAAPPANGQSQPVIFETERELVVTAAQLVSLFIINPAQDAYGDLGALINSSTDADALLFQGETEAAHVLYFSQETLLGAAGLKGVELTFNLQQGLGDNALLDWQVWNGAAWQTVTATENIGGSLNLRVTGENSISFGFKGPLPSSTVNGLSKRWMRCCLLTPVTPASAHEVGMVRASRLPIVEDVRMDASIARQSLPLDSAFINSLPLDTSKQFFPFSDRPKFGDTLYLASREAFSHAGSFVTLSVPLSNPSTANESATPIPPTYAVNNPQVQWEYWDGRNWTSLGTAVSTGDALRASSDPNRPLFKDTTRAFTRVGIVSFTIPTQPASTVVNGVENFWVRARLVSGNYGVEAHYDTAQNASGYQLVPSTLKPPAVDQLTSAYDVTLTATPDALWTFNDLAYEEVTALSPFTPFTAMTELYPTLYLGFALPANRRDFPNRNLTLYAGFARTAYGDNVAPVWPAHRTGAGDPSKTVVHSFSIINDSARAVHFSMVPMGAAWTTTSSAYGLTLAAGESASVEVTVTVPESAEPGDSDSAFLRITDSANPSVIHDARFTTYAFAASSSNAQLRHDWEYWNGARWAKLTVVDDTEGFTRSGLLEFVVPPDIEPRSEFGLPAQYWLRAAWTGGEYDLDPRINRILPNTTMATQTQTIRNEVLGSSDGSAGQRFRTTRAPVLLGQVLEVREPERPSVDELNVIEMEEGVGVVSVTAESDERQQQVWVRWHEVPDFYGSGPRDRHYVLDHLTGTVFFGDGSAGLIPPLGAGNVRLVQYRIGQGVSGNRPPGAITQLKTTVPYVESVTNLEAATGGAEAETLDSLLERAPRTIRHRNRAVTPEDYEDLGKLATPEVARTKCVPLYDLASDPDAVTRRLGLVSLIIVPRSTETKPLPSLELIGLVQDYIEARQIPTAELVVVGPEYIRVDVEVEVGLKRVEGASGVVAEIEDALSRYLHPLTGGLEGLGWDFGRKPHPSDLYVVLEAIGGVDYVKTLVVRETEERAGAGQTGRFLVYSGTHTIAVSYEED